MRPERDADAAGLSSQGAWAVGAAILVAGLTSLFYFWASGLSNLYGDGIAHLEGARRILDSRTPGYAEIGSVWLPLDHLLAAPLAQNDFLWRTGLAGSMISTAAFGLSAWLLFRLALEMSGNAAAGAVALAVFLLCPNMLYLASTPLTEPLALLWAILVVYKLFQYQRDGTRSALLLAALAAFCGTLTRYDEWYVLPFAALFVFWVGRVPWTTRLRHAALFLVVAGAGPGLWIVHNAYRFGNPLEFYNGPFSAKAIYAHQLATLAFRYPTDGSLEVSARYYLADLMLVIGFWPLVLSVLGLVAWLADAPVRARRATTCLFLVPLPFYLHAMAYAAVPLYVPTLFPHTYYNLRYGLEMLPAVALLASFLLVRGLEPRRRWVWAALLGGGILFQAISTCAGGVKDLAVAEEGILNTPCRSPRQEEIVRYFRTHYQGGTVLLALGQWPCVMPETGISFRNTLSEGDRDEWRELPGQAPQLVEWIICGDHDSVDELMLAHPEGFRDFELVDQKAFPGQGGVRIYRRSARSPIRR